jgi:hypothetical protein
MCAENENSKAKNDISPYYIEAGSVKTLIIWCRFEIASVVVMVVLNFSVNMESLSAK